MDTYDFFLFSQLFYIGIFERVFSIYRFHPLPQHCFMHICVHVSPVPPLIVCPPRQLTPNNCPVPNNCHSQTPMRSPVSVYYYTNLTGCFRFPARQWMKFAFQRYLHSPYSIRVVIKIKIYSVKNTHRSPPKRHEIDV